MGYRDNKRSLRQKMQDLMSTPKGQTIMNYAYNWGASVVIMGTLFKLVHLPGANFMLCLGMGTEVLIFFISAFDLSGVKRESKPMDAAVDTATIPTEVNSAVGVVSGTIPTTMAMPTNYTAASPATASGSGPSVVFVGGASAQDTFSTAVAQSGGTTQAAPPITPEMEEATTNYLEQLKAMTEMLTRCTQQAQAASQDTEQMNTLSRNLAGINAIYEMQLRSVSTQIGTIDQVHEQTRKMARQIEELNEVYARMLQAMTSSK